MESNRSGAPTSRGQANSQLMNEHTIAYLEGLMTATLQAKGSALPSTRRKAMIVPTDNNQQFVNMDAIEHALKDTKLT